MSTFNRRQLLSAAMLTAGGASALSRAGSAATDAMVKPVTPANESYNPVVTLNGSTLPYKLNKGVKEFHLVAEQIEREFAPGMKVKCWGYNGVSPGPTIEVVEGDTVRIFVKNKLPEKTSVHWHGLFLPNGMDGVGGLTQPHIPTGKTMVYEFTIKQNGSFMYHPHSDEMVQMAMGMMGLFIVHPKATPAVKIDRDYAFLLMSWDVEPGTMVPNASTITDFNLWTFNSKTFPAIQTLVARTGERVRIRIGNLSMTNHPIHLHGVAFKVVGTDGGWIPESAQWPEVTTDVPVGAMRIIEFVADSPGDWSLHCHKSHHTMGPMKHDVPNMMGVNQGEVGDKVGDLLPDYMYMPMGETGMGDMIEMNMQIPDNTLPMMTGNGPFGPIEMGGMFTVLKVRDDLKPGNYNDPGWYRHPKGSRSWLID